MDKFKNERKRNYPGFEITTTPKKKRKPLPQKVEGQLTREMPEGEDIDSLTRHKTYVI